ncbi:MAG TPA: hypothetical protein VFQ44_04840 [Streptosporangiaceae bacterium]|nr:hypothetical protein [Streptosporangiaceae bacterium]
MNRQGKAAPARRDARLELDRVITLLGSSDDRLIKNGVQAGCELIETYRARLRRSEVDAIRVALSNHLGNSDPQVRTWIYKLVAELGDGPYAPYLREQLRARDFVPTNRTWAVSALAAVSSDYKAHLQIINDELTLSYRLAAAMFAQQPDTESAVREASNSDDRLGHQWIGLLYGDMRANIRTEFVSELTSSNYPEVVEYAIWGLRKRHEGSISQVALDPENVRNATPNVRRWYYRLLLKDARNITRYDHQLRTWLEGERDSRAREGLAMGFYGIPVSPEWRELLRSWAVSERDPYVRAALTRRSDLRSATRSDAQQDVRARGRLTGYSDIRADSTDAIGQLSVRGSPGRSRRGDHRSVYKVRIYTGGSFVMHDRRNESVNVTNFGAIGSVQGAHSTLNQASEQGLIRALQELISAIRVDAAEAGSGNSELVAMVQDLHQMAHEPDRSYSWLQRIRTRLAMLSAFIGTAAVASENTDELLRNATDIIHWLL